MLDAQDGLAGAVGRAGSGAKMAQKARQKSAPSQPPPVLDIPTRVFLTRLALELNN